MIGFIFYLRLLLVQDAHSSEVSRPTQSQFMKRRERGDRHECVAVIPYSD